MNGEEEEAFSASPSQNGGLLSSSFSRYKGLAGRDPIVRSRLNPIHWMCFVCVCVRSMGRRGWSGSY